MEKPQLTVARRSVGEWLSSLPTLFILLTVIFLSSGQIIHSQLLKIGENTWDEYFLLRGASVRTTYKEKTGPGEAPLVRVRRGDYSIAKVHSARLGSVLQRTLRRRSIRSLLYIPLSVMFTRASRSISL